MKDYQAGFILDDYEMAMRSPVADNEILKNLAIRIVDLEKELIRLGIDSDTEPDTAKGLVGYMKKEPGKFRSWLEDKVISFYEYERRKICDKCMNGVCAACNLLCTGSRNSRYDCDILYTEGGI